MENNSISTVVLFTAFVIFTGSILYAECRNDKYNQICNEVCHPYAIVDCRENLVICKSASGKIVVDIK